MGNITDNSDALERARMQSPSQAYFSHDPQAETPGQRGAVEGGYKDQLAASRDRIAKSETKKAEELAGDAVSAATPMGAFSLLKQINFMTDMPYAAAFGSALLKDLLDLVDAETVILPIIFSILCSIFIFMMLLLVGANGNKKFANKLLKKTGILIAAGIGDSIPGIDFIPTESLTVAYLYFMELSERKHSK